MTDFEKECSEFEDRDYSVNNENVISWIRNSEMATVSFSQGRYVTKIKNMAEKHPDKVQIVSENKDGTILAHIPVKAIKINIIESRELTEEEIERNRKRLEDYRARAKMEREPLPFE